MGSGPNLYFDVNSTTAITREALAAMRPFLEREFGNPSSSSSAAGKVAKEAIEKARSELSSFTHAALDEIIFTGGGTESIFAAIIGALRARPERRHIVTTSVEHPAVLETVELAREMLGARVTILPVAADGSLPLEELEAAVGADTAVVSLMYANNETGVAFHVRE